MEAIRFKGRQSTAKDVRNTHMHTLVARIRCLLRSVLGKEKCSRRVCMQAWPWPPFDEMDAYQGGGGGGGAAAEPEEEVSDSSPSRLHSLLCAQS